ncbi:sensor histidine kinase [Paenibacillus terrigena]|uniref:sensor histidine kinase n=1 Tax=Paenibacillus terrigena TaxID=369333 RepID=UPI00036E91BA|nr:histidine kinase [Paenibacillus terrigena]
MFISFPNRLTLIITVTILIPTIFINLATFFFIKQEMQSDAASWLQGMTVTTGETMDSYTKLMDGITINPAYDYTLMNILETHRDNKIGLLGYTFDEIAQINGLLSMIWATNRKSLLTVELFDNNQNRFRLGEDILNSNMDWMNKARLAQGGSVLEPPVKIKDGQTVFSISRQLYKPHTFHAVGMIRVVFILDFLAATSHEVQQRDGNLLLVGENGSVLYDTRQKCNNKKLTDCIGKDQFNSSYKSDVSGWTLVGAMPVNQLFLKVNRIQKIILLVNTFFFVGALLVIVWLSFQMSRPLMQLSRKMQIASKNQFQIEVAETNRKDEIAIITTSFRNMIKHIQDLIAEVTVTEQRRKRSEISALQAQINPHFLYNTLSTIVMQAEIDGNYRISSMASQLGKLLRYAIGQEKEWVDVRRECEHIRLYVQVMRYRYPRVTLELLVDERVEDWSMIKLLMQPIVENAILHGIVPDGQEGMIRIRISAKEDLMKETLHIVIEDSGIGMNEDQLITLKKAISGLQSNETTTIKGMGVLNVYERIRLAYGDGPIRFDVESQVERGTRYIIELPRVHIDERHDRG